jgi:hypothetical protein
MTITGTRTMSVYELRRYEMRPGGRDKLIDLFEKHFLETQEACGMLPVGHYRDIDDDDSFVWLRAFSSMETRKAGLEAFYLHSDAWRENRDAANATMIDSDNVLLLRPARPDSGFDLTGLNRAPMGASETPASFVAVSIVMLPQPADEAVIANFEESTLPRLRQISERCAYFATEEQVNNFPRLPVREGEFCFVAAGVCGDEKALAAWGDAFPEGEFLRLKPAARSLLR